MKRKDISSGESFKIDPWKVEGIVDYAKLMSQFQTQLLDENLKQRTQQLTNNPLDLFFRRGILFSHRDYDKVLDDFSKGKGFFLYTGRAPSLGMHIGHLLPFLLTKSLQKKFKVNVYIEITDDEKFLSNRSLSLEMTRKSSYENILDIVALGFDPDRTFIFQDTEYIRQMYPLTLKIAKKLTFSELRSTFGFNASTNSGLLFYPALQMSVTMFEKEKRCLIPAGVDQDPYWRLQRDVAEGLGYQKTACLYLKFLPSLTGVNGKMSSSESESAIYLTDEPRTVREKILKYAFSGGQSTIKLHRKLGGKPEQDIAFQWLYFFFEPDDSKIQKIEEDYRSGRLLSGELKEILIEKLNLFLEEHKTKRAANRELVEVFKSTGTLATIMNRMMHD